MLEADFRSRVLDTAVRELGTVAANWYRMEAERLPVRGKTLEDLRRDYADIFLALPQDTTPEELEVILGSCVRSMRLREGDNVTITQMNFSKRDNPKTEIYDLERLMSPGVSEFYRYLAIIRLSPGSKVQSATVAAKIYIMFHFDIGTGFVTFDKALQEDMCKPDVQNDLGFGGYSIAIDPLIKLHSRWIARKLSQMAQEQEPESDQTDFSKFEGYSSEGSWLDDFRDDENKPLDPFDFTQGQYPGY